MLNISVTSYSGIDVSIYNTQQSLVEIFVVGEVFCCCFLLTMHLSHVATVCFLKVEVGHTTGNEQVQLQQSTRT